MTAGPTLAVLLVGLTGLGLLVAYYGARLAAEYLRLEHSEGIRR
ncbi:hypothetical protein [Natronorubrum daqingense]|uniref:Uncharacterized protein n=1 Tax=Natronorubrum daqingense TaxID=588898 RepID=A0A1N7G552_9EURY|nr:hypothetical protein [Natronorubrum daqingense]SIS07644.1 hypothetical protein SAMN05421809_3728 [Natronorubrum daqingense]